MSEQPVTAIDIPDGPAPGEELTSYRNERHSPDGTYVVVTNHTETIRMVPQPPTPEELEAQRKSERTAALLIGGIMAGFLALVGWAVWTDERSYRSKPEGSETNGTT
jgi:hypothetical protein